MYLNEFHNDENRVITITPAQASKFAKEIANDFNPLHNADNKRFCVPGDLLFSLVLAKYGVSQSMSFEFQGMVGGGVNLLFPESNEASFLITDNNDKSYLKVQRSGDIVKNEQLMESITRTYVAFSGENFPNVLVPLVKKQDVMINTARPMVIYQRMEFELSTLDIEDLTMEHGEAELEVDGKRGNVILHFNLFNNSKQVGQGKKHIVLGGLRAYDDEKMKTLCKDYEGWKNDYHKSK